MTDLLKDDQVRAALDAAPSQVRELAIQLLDLVTRPLSIREVEAGLRAGGASRTQAAKLAGALKAHRIILVTVNDAEGADDE